LLWRLFPSAVCFPRFGADLFNPFIVTRLAFFFYAPCFDFLDSDELPFNYHPQTVSLWPSISQPFFSPFFPLHPLTYQPKELALLLSLFILPSFFSVLSFVVPCGGLPLLFLDFLFPDFTASAFPTHTDEPLVPHIPSPSFFLMSTPALLHPPVFMDVLLPFLLPSSLLDVAFSSFSYALYQSPHSFSPRHRPTSLRTFSDPPPPLPGAPHPAFTVFSPLANLLKSLCFPHLAALL